MTGYAERILWIWGEPCVQMHPYYLIVKAIESHREVLTVRGACTTGRDIGCRAEWAETDEKHLTMDQEGLSRKVSSS